MDDGKLLESVSSIGEGSGKRGKSVLAGTCVRMCGWSELQDDKVQLIAAVGTGIG